MAHDNNIFSTNLIDRPVESRGIHECGTIGEMVTYRYYVGRLNMFEDQYDLAEKNFDFALRHCHKSASANKKRILNYLVPVKLLRGRLPTIKCKFHESSTFYASLRSNLIAVEFFQHLRGVLTSVGEVLIKRVLTSAKWNEDRKFDGIQRWIDEKPRLIHQVSRVSSSITPLSFSFQALITCQNEMLWCVHIRRGTYLLLEKCKMICYRNLFKRVYRIIGKEQIRLEMIARSFKWLGMPIDLDEVECILANLIFKQYIRGYLSHAKRVLVLSKKDPFPTSKVIKS